MFPTEIVEPAAEPFASHLTVVPAGPVFVAGHRGLVGSAVVRRLHMLGCDKVITVPREHLDLRVQADVAEFFEAHRPEHVVLAAARVGGILANAERPADFIRDNLAIQSNVIEACHRFRVRKLLFLGSSCIYPKFSPQPITEAALMSGPLEPTNEAYAVAKIAGLKACAAYNRQYGTNFISLMPTNLYGPGDNYDLRESHVLPALLRRSHEAKLAGAKELVVWGDGTARRELMHVDDLASACVFALARLDAADVGECVNVGVGVDHSILELAETAMRTVGFDGRIVLDPSKPNGTPRKLLDVSVLKNLGWSARITLADGIRSAYADFLERFER